MLLFYKKFFFLQFFFLVVFAFLPFNSVLASHTAGTVLGYAWSPQMGWVNFGNASGHIQVTDTAITGYAWSDNYGWINLGATQSGVDNNEYGTLSGRAWNEGTGWINFSGVTISDAGIFSGTATGDNDVTIRFTCDRCAVSTNWRKPGAPAQITPTFGTPAGSPSPVPPVTFSFDINNAAEATNNPAVTLKVNYQGNAIRMAVSNEPDFNNIGQEPYQSTKAWTLTPGDGPKTVYMRLYDQNGAMSSTVSSSILLDTQAPTITITKIKEKYLSTETVVLGGTTQSNAEVTLLVDNGYKIFYADQYGNWEVNLSKMVAGVHKIRASAKDSAGNRSNTVAAEFLVVQDGPVIEPPVPKTPPVITPAPPAPPGGGPSGGSETPPLPGETPGTTTPPQQEPSVPPSPPVSVIWMEGYIYKKNKNVEERVVGATVSLHWLNPNSGNYELWPANNFVQQNPQVTDTRGTYLSLLPNGKYYITVEANGYQSYRSAEFEVQGSEGITMNIELKPKKSFLNPTNWVLWATLLTPLILLSIIYLFYKISRRRVEDVDVSDVPLI